MCLRHLGPYPGQSDVVRNMYPRTIWPDDEWSGTSRLCLWTPLTNLTDTLAGTCQLAGVDARQRVPFLCGYYCDLEG